MRRKAGGVPETQAFATKSEIALAQVRQAIYRNPFSTGIVIHAVHRTVYKHLKLLMVK